MKNSGFTLVELLVTIGIVSILAAMGVANYDTFKDKAKLGVARNEVISLRTAVYTLGIDTGLMVDKTPATRCIGGTNELFLDSCALGLRCTDGTFPGWNGPYITAAAVRDPWGFRYVFDPDYHCIPSYNSADNQNCVNKNVTYKSIVSWNMGTETLSTTVYTSDNAVAHVCTLE